MNLDSFRSISFLPVMFELFEKLYTRCLVNTIDTALLMIKVQFPTTNSDLEPNALLHVEQVQCVGATTRQALKGKKLCPSVFSDVSQGFDKVWVTGLLQKISQHHLSNRTFYISTTGNQIQDSTTGQRAWSSTKDISAQNTRNTTLFTCADNTAILSPHENYTVTTSRLQVAVTEIVYSTTKWKIKIKVRKTVRVDFALRAHGYDPIIINNELVQLVKNVHCLGVTWIANYTENSHPEKKCNFNCSPMLDYCRGLCSDRNVSMRKLMKFVTIVGNQLITQKNFF